MKFTTFVFASMAAHLSAAHPEMAGQLIKEVKSRSAGNSYQLIGDLATDGATTPVGQAIKSIITGSGNPTSTETYGSSFNLLGLVSFGSGSGVPALGSSGCAADKCCVWSYISKQFANDFKGNNGECNNLGRAAIRLGFHDAAAWENGMTSGGADGSVILTDELSDPANLGLGEIGAYMKNAYNKWKDYGVSAADFVQMAASTATVVCPLGPRIRTFVGRQDSSEANDPGLLPDVHSPASDLIAQFQRKTIEPNGLVALLGAHTTSKQSFVDTNRAGAAQDSTPGTWDTAFYGQTRINVARGVFVFPSDKAIAAHPLTAGRWTTFTGPLAQTAWGTAYAREYVRLSLLGVNNINQLTECTKVLPQRQSLWIPREVVL